MKTAFCAVLILSSPLLSGAVDFTTGILPILESRCFRCHGNGESRGGLSLDPAEIEKHIRRSGAIRPGSSERSELFERITSEDESERMPKNGDALAEAEVELIKQWIDEGAKLEAEAPGDAPAEGGPMKQPERVKETWTNQEGRPLVATLLRVDGDKVVFLLENGTSVPYPIANLSAESQARVREVAGAAATGQ